MVCVERRVGTALSNPEADGIANGAVAAERRVAENPEAWERSAPSVAPLADCAS